MSTDGPITNFRVPPDRLAMNIVYASFDEVPSFKAASTHILANCRKVAERYRLSLLTLGEVVLPARGGFRHLPLSLRERNYLRRGLAFREYVRCRLVRDRPDLLHFRTPWEGLVAGELGLPNVYEVNGLPSIELPYLYRNAGERVLAVMRGWEQRCLDHADAIVCPSERIRDCLLRRYRIRDPDRIRVIPNGYDPLPAVAASPPDIPLRAVYLGTLHPWQGILWALRGFARLGGRFTLDIYGVGQRGWLRHAEKRIARHDLAGHVKLHPPVERGRLAPILSACHVGLAPLLKDVRNTEQGCCPVKIMDYLAHGLPTVAADLAVVRTLVEHGSNGVLFPPNSTRGFVDAMEEIYRRRMELPEWRARVLDSLTRFPTWEQCSLRMLEIYERIAMAHSHLIVRSTSRPPCSVL